MSYLLDTNVVSETRKRHPEPSVIHWLQATDPNALYLSVLTLGEITKGIMQRRHRDPGGADRMERWLSGLRKLFAERISRLATPRRLAGAGSQRNPRFR